MNKLLLIGGGGHCKSILQGLIRANVPIGGIIDMPEKIGSYIMGIPVIGSDNDLKEMAANAYSVIITIGSIGDNGKRMDLYKRVVDLGYNIANYISDRAILSGNVQVGEGSVVLDGAIINVDTTIGRNCIVNTGSIIEHDCDIGDHVHVAPGVVIGGCVKIEDEAFIGAGTVIKQGLKIGKSAVIGAGSVVIDDIANYTTVVGNPARLIK